MLTVLRKHGVHKFQNGHDLDVRGFWKVEFGPEPLKPITEEARAQTARERAEEADKLLYAASEGLPT